MQNLVTNYYLISAMGAWLLAQFLKIFTGFFKEQKFTLKALFFGTGGMPSSHTATVAALATACAIGEGFDSAIFAISVVLAIIVMIDATGVRRETGIQARVLNELTEVIEKMGSDLSNDEKLKEFVGHTPIQVFVGAVLGIIIALIYCLVIIK